MKDHVPTPGVPSPGTVSVPWLGLGATFGSQSISEQSLGRRPLLRRCGLELAPPPPTDCMSQAILGVALALLSDDAET